MEVFTTGRVNEGDLAIKVTRVEGDGIVINLKSSVGRLYDVAIIEQVERELKNYGLSGLLLDIEEDGAMPFVISARCEAIAKRLGKVIAEKSSLPQRTKTGKSLRRSRLYMPGNAPYLSQNARLFGADILILDLEDAVLPSEKYDTRILVKHALRSLEFGETESSVRINPLSSPFGEDDLQEIVPACPDIIFIPKAETKEDILNIHSIVESIKTRHGITHTFSYFPIIESAKGVINAYEIASSHPYVCALAFGAEDYTKDIGAERTNDGMETLYARYAVVTAAKAAGIGASDTVFSDLDDMEGYVKSCKQAKAMGFDGKGMIHPSQIDPLHEAFSPSESDIDYALKVCEAADEAEKNKSGVIALGRKMIDPPVIARARHTLDIARKLGLID